ncbi:MAG: NADH:ubiquinone reductase (Na(+)-transporting) subunit C [Candidatus Margulisbacteria bacterium]|nr:NADH:ubiquinone reductase (Na(+)-transporting) subunit C [Candidatus Margulisiibacteriota bacterium]
MLSKKPFVFALGLCMLCSFLLTNAATMLKPLQQKNQAIDQQKNILKVLGVIDTADGVDADDIGHLYATHIQQKWVNKDGDIVDTETNHPIFLYMKKRQVEAFAIPIAGYGLWSMLYGYFSIEGDGETVRGITFYQHGETPGLGAEVEAQWFQDNFVGKKIATAAGEFTSIGIVRGKVKDVVPAGKAPHYVDGISGATITSKGVETFLKEGLKHYEPFSKRLRNKELVM